MKVLFLDIDGVLNAHEWDDEAKSCHIRRECVKHLNRVIVATNCKIVLSSAWRYIVLGGSMTWTGFEYMLRTHGLIGEADRRVIVGHTRADDPSVIDPANLPPDERARQIKDWLAWRNEYSPVVSAFAAVDDLDLGFAAHGIPFVQTDGTRGLTGADAERLIDLLGRAPTDGGAE